MRGQEREEKLKSQLALLVEGEEGISTPAFPVSSKKRREWEEEQKEKKMAGMMEVMRRQAEAGKRQTDLIKERSKDIEELGALIP